MEVSGLNSVSASSGPGNMQLTSAAAVMPPSICTTDMITPLAQPRLPMQHMPIVIAGLNSPLVTLKNTQALTVSEKPKLKAVYSNDAVSVVTLGSR